MKKKKWGIFCMTGFLILTGFVFVAAKIQKADRPGSIRPSPQASQVSDDISYSVYDFAVSPADAKVIYVSFWKYSASLSTYTDHLSMDGGSTWTDLPKDYWELVPHPHLANVVFTCQGKVLYISSDYGMTWTPVAQLPLNYRKFGFFVIDPADDRVLYYSATNQYAGERYSPRYESSLYRSMDGGVSWTLLFYRKDDFFYSLNLDPRNSEILYLSAGPAMKSLDRGANWISLGQGFQAMAVDPLHEGVIYGVRDYILKKSIDGGLTWTDAQNGLEGENTHIVLLQFHPGSPETLILIRDGTYSSRDGAASWQKISGHGGGWKSTIASTPPYPFFVMTSFLHKGSGPLGSMQWQVIFPKDPPEISLSVPQSDGLLSGIVPVKVKASAPRGIAWIKIYFQGETLKTFEGGGAKTMEFTWEWDTRNCESQCDEENYLDARVRDQDDLTSDTWIDFKLGNFSMTLDVKRVERDRAWIIRRENFCNKVVATIQNRAGLTGLRYVIEKVPHPGGWPPTYKNFSEADLVKGTYVWLDFNIAKGKAYTYKLRAKNAKDNTVCSTYVITVQD